MGCLRLLAWYELSINCYQIPMRSQGRWVYHVQNRGLVPSKLLGCIPILVSLFVSSNKKITLGQRNNNAPAVYSRNTTQSCWTFLNRIEKLFRYYSNLDHYMRLHEHQFEHRYMLESLLWTGSCALVLPELYVTISDYTYIYLYLLSQFLWFCDRSIALAELFDHSRLLAEFYYAYSPLVRWPRTGGVVKGDGEGEDVEGIKQGRTTGYSDLVYGNDTFTIHARRVDVSTCCLWLSFASIPPRFWRASSVHFFSTWATSVSN